MEIPFQMSIYSFSSVYVLHQTEFSKKRSLSYSPMDSSGMAEPELKAGRGGREAALELDAALQ